MRLRIRHETRYAYERPAAAIAQVLRLTPRSYEGLSVRRWGVEVDADCRLARGEDAHGNVLHRFELEGPVGGLRVVAEGEVETHDTGGVARGATERLPIELYLRPTALTAPSPAILAFAREAGRGEPLEALHGLLRGLNTAMAFAPGTTVAATSAADAFDAGRGVCQDLAQVFAAAARSLGFPARYAGGYFLRSDTDEQDAGHAWAEAFVPDLGWVGFDPANGVCADERHVRVAAGLDSLDAAPVRGHRLGGAGETMSVLVTVARA